MQFSFSATGWHSLSIFAGSTCVSQTPTTTSLHQRKSSSVSNNPFLSFFLFFWGMTRLVGWSFLCPWSLSCVSKVCMYKGFKSLKDIYKYKCNLHVTGPFGRGRKRGNGTDQFKRATVGMGGGTPMSGMKAEDVGMWRSWNVAPKYSITIWGMSEMRSTLESAQNEASAVGFLHAGLLKS